MIAMWLDVGWPDNHAQAQQLFAGRKNDFIEENVVSASMAVANGTAALQIAFLP
jgi:hypothetical protein